MPRSGPLQGNPVSPDAMSEQRVLALGLGGAGNDLLTHLIDSSPNGIYCVAADTDRYHLQIARAHSKILMQDAGCSDAGTTGDVRIGKRAALQTPSLKEVLSGMDLVFVLAGMGGGTGGGAAPVVSDFARKNGSLVVGLITKPFSHERSRVLVAIDSIRMMLNTCDTVILIENQSSTPSSLSLPFGLYTDMAGQTCCAVVSSITRALIDSGLLNSNLEQFRGFLRGGGLAKVSTGESYSLCGAEEAALNALRTTMALDLADAKGIFVDILEGQAVADSDIEPALDAVCQHLNPDVQFLCNRRVDPNLLSATRVNLLVTGVSFPYSWGGYRRLPIQLYELEPDAGEDEKINVDLALHQLEDSAAQANL